jgi:perosamine synthetase
MMGGHLVSKASAWMQLSLSERLPAQLFSAPQPTLLDPVVDIFDESDAAIAERWLWWPYGRAAGITADFMRAFALWNGSRHAFTFAAGRVALSACIHALDLQPGDEVIAPGYTCVVVANAFDFAGVRIVYGDIELETYGLDADSVAARLTPKTRALLIQHSYGLVCRDYERLLALARQHGLRVIEDCCHATGAEVDGLKVGNRGDVAYYSSERSKVFSTIMGGIAVTNDDAIARRLRAFHDQAEMPTTDWSNGLLRNVLLAYYSRNHGKRDLQARLAERLYGTVLIATTGEEIAGRQPIRYVRKMAPSTAAIGLNQLRRIDAFNRARRGWATRWQSWCERHGYTPPLVVARSSPVYLRYPILVEPEKKADTSWAREQLGVELGVWFTTKLHPAERSIAGCPNADTAVRRCVNLPCPVSEHVDLA